LLTVPRSQCGIHTRAAQLTGLYRLAYLKPIQNLKYVQTGSCLTQLSSRHARLLSTKARHAHTVISENPHACICGDVLQKPKMKLRQSFSDKLHTFLIREWCVNRLLQMLQDILLHCQYLKASHGCRGCFQLDQML